MEGSNVIRFVCQQQLCVPSGQGSDDRYENAGAMAEWLLGFVYPSDAFVESLYNKLMEGLNSGIVIFRYTTKAGYERRAVGTLNEDLIQYIRSGQKFEVLRQKVSKIIDKDVENYDEAAILQALSKTMADTAKKEKKEAIETAVQIYYDLEFFDFRKFDKLRLMSIGF